MEDISLKVRTVVELLILPIMGFGVMKLDKMADNVQELNMKVAVVITERRVDKEIMQSFDQRLRDIERKK